MILNLTYVIAKSSRIFTGSAERTKGNKPKEKKNDLNTETEKKCTKFKSTVFPRIIAGGNYLFFHIQRGQLLEGAIISNIAHWKSSP